MFHWINSHGIEVLIGYYIMISVLGTMPPLPENASYLAKWAFAAGHAFCGNMQRMAQELPMFKNGTTPKKEE